MSDKFVKAGGPGSGRHKVNGIELTENPNSPGAPGFKSLVGGRTFGRGDHAVREITIRPDFNPSTGKENGQYFAEIGKPNGTFERS